MFHKLDLHDWAKPSVSPSWLIHVSHLRYFIRLMWVSASACTVFVGDKEHKIRVTKLDKLFR